MRKRVQRTLRVTLLTAATASLFVVSLVSPTVADEFRGFWVDGWGAGFLNQTQVDKLVGVVGNGTSKGDIRNANCNAIIMQARRRADVCYPSGMGEPYHSGLSPSNFNALQAVINGAHDTTGGKQRLEVHAWMVTFATGSSGVGGLVYSQHNNPADPDNYWVTLSSTGAETDDKAFDPGHPKCLKYLVDVSMDLVNNFDIDGIHYDYIRFTANNQGYNPTSIARFNARYGRTGQPSPTDELFKQWRRDQVTALVRQVYARVQAAKPSVKVSGAFVTWNPSPASSNRTSFQATRPYYDVYSDWDSWMQEGIVDMAVPMTYYNWASLPNDYVKWMNFEKDRKFNRHMVIGPGIYLNSLQNAIDEILMTRDPSPAGNYCQGWCGYSYRVPYASGTWAGFSPELVSQVTPTPDNIPPMPWKTSPTKGHIMGTAVNCGTWLDGVTVTLSGAASRTIPTDGTGFYTFIDLNPGSYTVSITYNGSTQNKPVTVTAGQMSTVDFDFCPANPPVITNVRAENVGPSSADVKWTTDIGATSQVEYGLTTSYGSTTVLDSALVTSHAVQVSGLSPGTLYHYRVRSKNSGDVETVSGDYTFTTTTDTTAPVISNVQVASVTSTQATITWTTDDPASSQVQFGLTSAYGQSTTEDSALVTSHSVTVEGLTPNTLYHFRVKSTNAVSLSSYSGDGTLTTLLVPGDIIIDDVQASVVDGVSPYTWSTGAYAGGWPTDASSYRFVWNRKTSETASCTWTPSMPVAGTYDVYIWFLSGSNRTTSARYTIHGAAGDTVAYVNQTNADIDSQWYRIGTNIPFSVGTSGYVRLTNITGETNQTKVIIADAVKFVFTGDAVPPSVPQNLQAAASSSTGITLTWSASADNVGVAGYRIYRNSVQVGTSATTSYADSGLTANTQYSYTVSAYDAGNNESGQSSAAGRYTLSTPPTTSTITCDRTSGTWYNTPPFTFSNAGFGAGKVEYYLYLWDNSPSHTWTGSETVWASASKVANATTSAPDWYFHVRGYNAEGVANGSLSLGPYRYDGIAPELGAVTNTWYLKKIGITCDDLAAAWSGSDGQSGIAEYQYAVGTSVGGTEILSWTSTTATSASYHYADALAHDYRYYWSVKAKDSAGNWSTISNSHWSVYASVFPTLAAAMNNPDATPVIVDVNHLLRVTANLGTCLYVQEDNRTRGLRLNCTAALVEAGNWLNVSGTLATVAGQRLLTDVEYSGLGTGANDMRPLAMAIGAIGGAAPDAFTPGVPGAVGCYNLGLLVKTAGRVVTKGSGHFVLADGAGASVRVYSTVVPPDNGFVSVTGVVSLEGNAPVIWCRAAADVQTY